MPNRNLFKVQEALNALTDVQLNINELYYYKKHLKKPNHSASACSSVRTAIDNLRSNHTNVVEALKFYGNSYSSIDASLAGTNNPNSPDIFTPKEFYYVAAPEHQKSGWEKFWNQIILGEFSEDVTWQGVTGNVVVSLVAGFFGVDAPLDIRDAAGNFSKGEWGWGLLDCVFLLPVIGAFKPVKYADEVVDVIKYGDEAADVLKYGDEAVDSVLGKADDIITDGSHIIDGKLKPNVTYKTGEYDYIYKTDSSGRISNWSTDDLKLTQREQRLPHNSSTPGKTLGDDAGHLIGDRFGGSSDIDNLVSQSAHINRSEYKKIENQWAKAIKDGKRLQ